MSEKEKMQSEELAKTLADNPAATVFLAGMVQGIKLARTDVAEAERETKADQEGGK